MNKENTKVVNASVEDKNKDKQDIILINEETIQNKIYVVRGQKVMLDVDLAEIYGYETKNFNRQVKNNCQKFEGDDFEYSGLLYTTCPEFGNHHSGVWVPLIPA